MRKSEKDLVAWLRAKTADEAARLPPAPPQPLPAGRKAAGAGRMSLRAELLSGLAAAACLALVLGMARLMPYRSFDRFAFDTAAMNIDAAAFDGYMKTLSASFNADRCGTARGAAPDKP